MTIQLAIIVPALLGVAISFLTELLTKSSAPQSVKSFVSIVLSTAAGVVSTIVYDQSAPWTTYAGAVLVAWITAIATHYTGATRVLQDASPNFGLGPAHEDPNDPVV